jgi:hypothetical protein
VLGNLTASTAVITGTLTAQTLVVQTVTSSIVYSSGSNLFGSVTSNLQTFTGSIQASGSSNHFLLGGNVGIGTLSPSAPLEIYASSNSKLILNATLNTSSYQNQIDFKNAGTSSAFIQSGKNPDNTAIGLAFGTTVEVMRITGSTLYVGITGSVYYSSPSLVVGSTLATSVPLQVISDASGRNIRLYNAEYNGSTLGSTLRLGFLTGSGNTSSTIQAYALGESTTGSLTLNPNGGYVGIGITNPSRGVLDVRGGRINLGGNSSDALAVMTMGDATYPIGNIVAPYPGGAINIQSVTGTGLWVSGSGNVGIGTSSPQSVLHTYQAINTDSLWLLNNASSGTSATARVDIGVNAGSYALTLMRFGLNYSGTTFGTTAANTTYVYDNAASSNGMKIGTGTSSPIIFGTAGTERARIDSSGLKFQNGSSYLNYYEEGIYTPTLTMSTSGTVTASTWWRLYYTRIGRLVHIFGEIRLTSVSSPVGQLNISLPYTSAPDGTTGGAASLLARGASSVESYSIGTINSSIYMYLAAGSSYMSLYYLSNGSNQVVDGATMLSGNEEIGINMTYLTS